MDRIKSFRQRSDLIEFDQNRIGRLKLDPTADPPGVRYKQIISYQLNILTQTTGKLLPALPVIFLQSIFKRYQWKFCRQRVIVIDHLICAPTDLTAFLASFSWKIITACPLI